MNKIRELKVTPKGPHTLLFNPSKKVNRVNRATNRSGSEGNNIQKENFINFISGFTAGTIEPFLLGYPATYVKIRAEAGGPNYKETLNELWQNPKAWFTYYRGIKPFLCYTSLTMALEYGALERVRHIYKIKETSNIAGLFAFACGYGISPIVTWAERVILQQQQLHEQGKPAGFKDALQTIWHRKAVAKSNKTKEIAGFFKAGVGVSFREGAYATGIWFLEQKTEHVLRKKIGLKEKEITDFETRDFLIKFLASALAAVPVALATQPLDMITTIMQRDNSSFKNATKAVQSQFGTAGFWRGAPSRIITIGSACFFIPLITKLLAPHYQKALYSEEDAECKSLVRE